MSEGDWLAWDKHIERDLLDGRLDKLIDEATEEHSRGLTLSFEEGKRVYQEMSDKK